MNRSVSGITKHNKRSIQEIKKERGTDNSSQQSENRGGGRSPHRRPPRQRSSEKAATFGLWFVGVVGVLFIFFLFSLLFAETTVTVQPRTAAISIDDTFSASNSSTEPGVPFTLIGVEESITLTATSTGSEYREAAASGSLTIYNDYSEDAIRLVPNTRFRTPSGLIYRTREPVTIPGQTASGAPGTVTVRVYADEFGDTYNIGPSEFSIPGFAGTPYEGLVYAESSTAMTGGVAAEVPIISEDAQASLREQASSTLRSQLAQKLNTELPEGFVAYEDGQFFTTEIIESETTSTGETEVTVSGRLRAVTFDTRQLSSYLATTYSDDVSEEADIRIRDLADFEFDFVNKSEFNPGADQTFDFSLDGDSLIVWQYNERALIRDLRGLQKNRFNEVLVNYPGIQKAEVVTRPFWKRTLPTDAGEISVNTVID